MSRTKRYNQTKYQYFRTPRCKSDYTREAAAIEQLTEEGFHHNRASQRSNPNGQKTTPSSYDDIDFASRGELKHIINKEEAMTETISTKETKVIFRAYKDDGEIIAMFPEEVGTDDPYTCASFQRGRHYTCYPSGLVQITTSVEPEKYQILKEQLESMNYKLKVVSKLHPSYFEVRQQKINQTKESVQQLMY